MIAWYSRARSSFRPRMSASRLSFLFHTLWHWQFLFCATTSLADAPASRHPDSVQQYECQSRAHDAGGDGAGAKGRKGRGLGEAQSASPSPKRGLATLRPECGSSERSSRRAVRHRSCRRRLRPRSRTSDTNFIALSRSAASVKSPFPTSFMPMMPWPRACIADSSFIAASRLPGSLQVPSAPSM